MRVVVARTLTVASERDPTNLYLCVCVCDLFLSLHLYLSRDLSRVDPDRSIYI